MTNVCRSGPRGSGERLSITGMTLSLFCSYKNHLSLYLLKYHRQQIKYQFSAIRMCCFPLTRLPGAICVTMIWLSGLLAYTRLKEHCPQLPRFFSPPSFLPRKTQVRVFSTGKKKTLQIVTICRIQVYLLFFSTFSNSLQRTVQENYFP